MVRMEGGSSSRRSRSRQRTLRQSRSHRTPSRRKYRVTRNAFINFLRDFRRANRSMKVTEAVKRGAEVWRRMNDSEKSPYRQMAREAPRRRRRKGRSRRRRRHRESSDTERSEEPSEDSKRGSTDSESK